MKLSYIDHEGVKREIKGCELTVDHLDRHWIWCPQLEYNLVYKTKGFENALISSIDSLLFAIELRDRRIEELSRIVNLASKFSQEAFPDEESVV